MSGFVLGCRRFKGWIVVGSLGLMVATLLSVEAAKPIPSQPGFDWRLYNTLLAEAVETAAELADDFNEAQANFLRIMPPGQSLLQPLGLRPFTQGMFPTAALTRKDLEILDGVATYPVTVHEDPKTRERVISSRAGRELARVAAPEGYDPWFILAEQRPDLANVSAEEFARLQTEYEPSRISVSYLLILPKDLLAYCWLKSVQKAEAKTDAWAAATVEEPTTRMLLMGDGGGPATNLKVVAMERLDNALQLSIGFPEGYTNVLDIFCRSNLCAGSWQLLETNVSVAGGSPVSWTTSTAQAETQFYIIGNGGDEDGDGLRTAQEKLLFGLDPFDPDMDRDGVKDGTELAQNSNPKNADSDADGATDGEELLAGTDPGGGASPPGLAGDTIRYYYDTDDRLVGAFAGTAGAASRTENTPAGNVVSSVERSAP